MMRFVSRPLEYSYTEFGRIEESFHAAHDEERDGKPGRRSRGASPRRAQRYVDRFGQDTVVQRYRSIYQRLTQLP